MANSYSLSFCFLLDHLATQSDSIGVLSVKSFYGVLTGGHMLESSENCLWRILTPRFLLFVGLLGNTEFLLLICFNSFITPWLMGACYVFRQKMFITYLFMVLILVCGTLFFGGLGFIG